jgi:autotransporter-associated beta strand protein
MSSASGTYNLNDGVLAVHGLAPGSGKAAFSFGSGTLRADAAFTSTLPMTLAGTGGNATVNTNGYAVSLSGFLSGTGGLTKSGTGTLTLNGTNTYIGRTTIAGGLLELGPSAQNCVLNLGGADIQSGSIVFDYTGEKDPIATIQSLLKASYDGGRWDVGQFRDSTALATGLTLGCFDNTATDQVKVMATYPGDFNLDGVVNNLDYAIWAANVFTGSTWQQGDANYDGAVNGLDRDLWVANVGLPQLSGALPAAGVTPAPEPSTLALLLAGGVGLLAYAWRRRRV